MLFRSYTMCVFLDIKGAFDNISIEACLAGARRCGIPEHIIKWFSSLLRNRVVTANVNGVSQTRLLNNGTPQGDCWSPKLFCMAIDHILQELNSHGVTCVGFADDMVLTMTGLDLTTLKDRLQQKANQASRMLRELGLSLNASKTEIVIFTRKTTVVKLSDFILDGVAIEISDEAKYLGVTLDSKLNFETHKDNKANAARKSIFSARNLVWKKWGPTPRIMREVYKTIVRPKIDYACHIWQHKKGRAPELEKVQRQAMMTFAPTWQSMPTIGLQVIWGIPPIHLHLERIAKNTYARIKGVIKQTHRGEKEGYFGHLDVLKRCSYMPDVKVDKARNRAKSKLYSIKIPPDKGKVNIPPPNEEEIHVYTDGSKLDGLAGLGVHIEGKEDIHKHLGASASVFQGEVLAIKIAAEALKDEVGKTITVRSDSQAALMALDNEVFSNITTWECHQALNKLGEQNQVIIQWVKAHVGTAGNERADQLAKEGAKPGSPRVETPIPLAEIKLANQRSMVRRWQEAWDKDPEARHTYNMLPKADNKVYQDLGKFGRAEARKYLEYITGHCHFRKHRKTMGGDNSPYVDSVT